MVCGLCLAWLGLLQAPPASAVAAVSEAGSFSVQLEYQELASPVFQAAIPSRPAVFLKEPAGLGRVLTRGYLPFGLHSNQWVGYLYDPKGRTLRVDWNRNGDLTDDPAGLCGANHPSGLTTFTNLRFEARCQQGRQRYLADVVLRERGAQQAGLRSLYQGRLELNGKVWQVGLVLDPFQDLEVGTRCVEGGFLWRPWEDRDKPFVLVPSWETIEFTTNLFVGGQAYQLQIRFEPRGEEAVLRLEGRPRTVPLATVRLPGSNIHRVAFEKSDGYSAVLDGPGATARVPAGCYSNLWVVLKKGESEAMLELRAPLELSTNDSSRLPLGGPLTNLVRVDRSAGQLRLVHRIVGVDGLVYQLLKARAEVPRFEISLRGKRLAVGQFEYG